MTDKTVRLTLPVDLTSRSQGSRLMDFGRTRNISVKDQNILVFSAKHVIKTKLYYIILAINVNICHKRGASPQRILVLFS